CQPAAFPGLYGPIGFVCARRQVATEQRRNGHAAHARQYAEPCRQKDREKRMSVAVLHINQAVLCTRFSSRLQRFDAWAASRQVLGPYALEDDLRMRVNDRTMIGLRRAEGRSPGYGCHGLMGVPVPLLLV